MSMHPNELSIDLRLVRALVAAQFPQWAGLPLERVDSAGTDNAIYRLADDLAVRLPRVEYAAGQIEKERRWLARLAPALPLRVPVPVALGVPALGYPWHWSVCPWLAGVDAHAARVRDEREAALDLARFISALRGIDAASAPRAGVDSSRGVPLATRDGAVRTAIAELGGAIDGRAVTSAWESALRAPVWDGDAAWFHGDLLPGNLLVHDGRIHAVIDFGCLAAGDPACDVLPAWAVLSRRTRGAFREALAADDAMWARGRGWALSVALIILPYYERTNPVLCEIARYAIGEVLSDLSGA